MSVIYEPAGRARERLTVLSEEKTNGRIYCNCKCLCGRTVKVMKSNLKRTHSCGCYKREWAKDKATTHGHRRARIYRIWSGMIYRCKNASSPKYSIYGGRGIDICERWESFENFLKDMGEPDNVLSIERIDNSKGYSKDNCKWATAKEQNNNTRRNHIIEYNGKIQSIAKWAEELGVNYNTLKTRLRRGWTFGEAIR